MYLDLHNIPENTDWQSLFWRLNDEYHAALLEIIDLKASLHVKWQPIETAPTDGTVFIGLKGKHVAPTQIGKYYVKWPHEVGGPTFSEKWNKIQTDSICPWKPTHWTYMPNL